MRLNISANFYMKCQVPRKDVRKAIVSPMKKLLKSLSVIIIISAAFYGYFYTDLLTVKTIEYNENPNIDLYEVQRYSGIALGDRFFKTPIKKAIAGLEEHPYILKASGRKEFPNKIYFDLTFREHFVSIHYSGIVLSLDDQLTVLRVLEVPDESYAIEGFAFESFSTGDTLRVQKKYVLENIVLLIKLLKSSHITAENTITYQEDSIVVKVDEIRVKFGNGDNIEYKFNAFVNVYEALKKEEITSGVIDVSTDGLPAYRPFGE